MAEPVNVLMLCTGNSARSILAEAILNRVGRGRFRAYSAGSQPRGAPHPGAIAILAQEGYDTAFARSKSWDEFAGPEAPKMDIVLTLCDSAAAEHCPYWPGHPMVVHWGLPDPAAEAGEPAVRSAFRQAHDVLCDRMSRLAALPLETMPPAALREALRGLGAVPNGARA